MGKISVSHVLGKGIASTIHKELLKLKNKKISNNIKKWARNLNKNFSDDI